MMRNALFCTIVISKSLRQVRSQGVPSPSPSSPSFLPSGEDFDIVNSLSCRELDPDILYWCPAHRYCDWNGQTFYTQAWLSDRLLYSMRTWNYFLKNRPVEKRSYETLSPDVIENLEQMGYDVDKHECCFTHYELYGWDEFDTYQMVDEQNAWAKVGYDQNKWDNVLNIPNIQLEWDALSQEIREALQLYLCYNRELWNETPLEDWPDDAVLPGTYDMEEPIVEAPTDTPINDSDKTLSNSPTSNPNPTDPTDPDPTDPNPTIDEPVTNPELPTNDLTESSKASSLGFKHTMITFQYVVVLYLFFQN